MITPHSNRRATEAQQYYDDFVDHQVSVGVNQRHHSILGHLKRSGLEPHHRVLEIGCGVGTLTELLLKYLGPGGSVLATDLSPKSVDVARSSLSQFVAVELMAGDILDLDIPGKFDVVVLPDVIEHIPLEHHPRLFARIAFWLRPGGFVLLHYPNPNFLEWCQEHKPDQLQVIDQPVHTDVLTANAYPHGLYLDFLETYSIWVHEGDYQVTVMRRRVDATHFTEMSWRPPLRQKLREALVLRARLVLGRIRAWRS